MGKHLDNGKDPEKENQHPKVWESYNAIELAGKELVTKGGICRKSQKTASQNIIPVPFFSILKNFKGLKKIA